MQLIGDRRWWWCQPGCVLQAMFLFCLLFTISAGTGALILICIMKLPGTRSFHGWINVFTLESFAKTSDIRQPPPLPNSSADIILCPLLTFLTFSWVSFQRMIISTVISISLCSRWRLSFRARRSQTWCFSDILVHVPPHKESINLPHNIDKWNKIERLWKL